MREHVRHVTENGRLSDKFIREVVEPLMKKFRRDSCPDQPISSTPARTSRAKETAKFLQPGLNPRLIKYNCGLVLVHHTPKTNQRDTTEWKATSDIFSSWCRRYHEGCRACLVIEPQKSSQAFKFIAAKRGSRIEGPTIFPAIARRPVFQPFDRPNMFWRDAEQTEVKAAKNEPSKRDDILALIPEVGSIAKKAVISRAGQLTPPIGVHKTDGFISDLIANGTVFIWRVKRPKIRPAIHLARYEQPPEPAPEQPEDDQDNV